MKTQIIRNNYQLNNNSLFDLFVGMSDWIHRPKKKMHPFLLDLFTAQAQVINDEQ